MLDNPRKKNKNLGCNFKKFTWSRY